LPARGGDTWGVLTARKKWIGQFHLAEINVILLARERGPSNQGFPRASWSWKCKIRASRCRENQNQDLSLRGGGQKLAVIHAKNCRVPEGEPCLQNAKHGFKDTGKVLKD